MKKGTIKNIALATGITVAAVCAIKVIVDDVLAYIEYKRALEEDDFDEFDEEDDESEYFDESE